MPDNYTNAWIKYLDVKSQRDKHPIKFRPRFRSHTCDRWGRPITLVPNEYPERATNPTMAPTSTNAPRRFR